MFVFPREVSRLEGLLYYLIEHFYTSVAMPFKRLQIVLFVYAYNVQ